MVLHWQPGSVSYHYCLGVQLLRTCNQEMPQWPNASYNSVVPIHMRKSGVGHCQCTLRHTLISQLSVAAVMQDEGPWHMPLLDKHSKNKHQTHATHTPGRDQARTRHNAHRHKKHRAACAHTLNTYEATYTHADIPAYMQLLRCTAMHCVVFYIVFCIALRCGVGKSIEAICVYGSNLYMQRLASLAKQV